MQNVSLKFNNWITNKVKPYFKNYNNLFYYVVFLCIMAVAFYAGSLFVNGFTINPSGDYVYQDIPFYYNGYDDWWHFFKTGEFPFWDSNTFLGADNLSNNAFYYVFNPFFLISLFFPRAWIIHMMSLSLMAKSILASLFFRMLLKHFGVKEKEARIFAMCYGFGGWVFYYVWFNCYLDIATFFPLVLLGIEKILHKEKPFTLVIGLFLVALSNFYFIVPVCIGSVIYALFRWCQLLKKNTYSDNLKHLGIGVAAFALGLSLAGFLLFPALMNVFTYSRGTSYLTVLKTAIEGGNFSEVWGILTSWEKYAFNPGSGFSANTTYGFRAWYPLMSFFFPPTDGRNVSILNYANSNNRYDSVASSLFMYTPLLLIFFASIFKSVKDKKWSHLIAILFFVIALQTPFFYFLFLGFSSAYGRWEFLPFAFAIIYCAISFNNRETYKKWYFDVSYLVCLLAMSLLISASYMLDSIYPDTASVTIKNPGWRAIVMAISLVYITILYFLIRNNFKKPKLLTYGKFFILGECVLMGVYFTISHGYTNYYSSGILNGVDNLKTETNLFAKLNDSNDSLYDPTYYRVQSGRIINSGCNIAMAENYNGTAFFHSLYNSSIDQFLSWTSISRSPNNWTGEAIQKKPLLDTFLGVKYYLTKDVETNFGVSKPTSKVIHVNPNIPFGYEEVLRYKDYQLFENTNSIELGFSFDTVLDAKVTTSDDRNPNSSLFFSGNEKQELNNEYNFLKTAVYPESQLTKIKKDYANLFDNNTLSETTYKNVNLTYEPFSYQGYKLSQSFDPNDPNAYLTTGTKITSGFYYGDTIMVIEPKNEKYFNTENSVLYLNKPISSTNKIGYFLIDENGKTITYDNSYLFSNGGWYRYFRSLYTGESKVSKIIAVSYAGESNAYNEYTMKPSSIYSYTYAQYMSLINELKEHPLENITHGTNSYKFETNYDSQRVIVLNVPYSDGWVAKVKTGASDYKEIPIYKADGGMISFVASAGKDVKYVIDFKSTHFNQGFALTCGSLFILALMGFYSFVEHKMKTNNTMILDPKRAGKKFFKETFKEELNEQNKKEK